MSDYDSIPIWDLLPPRPVSTRELAAALPDVPAGQSVTAWAYPLDDGEQGDLDPVVDEFVVHSIGYRLVRLVEYGGGPDAWEREDSWPGEGRHPSAEEHDTEAKASLSTNEYHGVPVVESESITGTLDYVADNDGSGDARTYMSRPRRTTENGVGDTRNEPPVYSTLSDPDELDSIRRALYEERVKADAAAAPDPLDEQVADAKAPLYPDAVEDHGILARDMTLTAEPGSVPEAEVEFVLEHDPHEVPVEPAQGVRVRVEVEPGVFGQGATGTLTMWGPAPAVSKTIIRSWGEAGKDLFPGDYGEAMFSWDAPQDERTESAATGLAALKESEQSAGGVVEDMKEAGLTTEASPSGVPLPVSHPNFDVTGDLSDTSLAQAADDLASLDTDDALDALAYSVGSNVEYASFVEYGQDYELETDAIDEAVRRVAEAEATRRALVEGAARAQVVVDELERLNRPFLPGTPKIFQ